MIETVTIATRASRLALWQAYHVRDALQKKFPGLSVELLEVTSTGDKILDKPLALIGGKGLFTKEIEEVMLEGRAQLAVHSLKDVPTLIPDGLRLAAITKRDDPRDVFLSHTCASLDALEAGAVVGTTSLRRRMQLLARRPDLKVKDLRGNVNTRLRKLREGEYDAIILAYVGMKRLELLDEIPFHHPIGTDLMIPPMGQAALGVEAVDDPDVLAIAETLNDNESALAAKIERDFVHRLEGSCQVPIGIYARSVGENIRLDAVIGYPDGNKMLRESLFAPLPEAGSLGAQLAETMIAQGALELLKEAEAMAFKDERCERL